MELPVEGFEVLGVEFGFPIYIVAYGDGGCPLAGRVRERPYS